MIDLKMILQSLMDGQTNGWHTLAVVKLPPRLKKWFAPKIEITWFDWVLLGTLIVPNNKVPLAILVKNSFNKNLLPVWCEQIDRQTFVILELLSRQKLFTNWHLNFFHYRASPSFLMSSTYGRNLLHLTPVCWGRTTSIFQLTLKCVIYKDIYLRFCLLLYFYNFLR